MSALNGETPLIICEGDDDLALLTWLRDNEGISGLQIAKLDGIDPLAKKAQVLIKGIPGGIAPTTVGLVLDADRDPLSRREAARDALMRAAPTSRHRIYLYPDDASVGMLEDLYLSACRLPGLASCARGYVACAMSAYEAPLNESKVAYEAYRSVIARTHRGIVHGIAAGDVDPTHSSLRPLIDFLRDLAS